MNRFFDKEWERVQTEKLIQKHEERVAKLETKLTKKGVIALLQKNPKPIPEKMVTIIAAVGRNRALGKDNDLIWHSAG